MHIRQSEQSPLDSAWHQKLGPLLEALGETFRALELDPLSNSQALLDFKASGFRKSPELYPSGDMGKFNEIRAALVQLTREVSGDEDNPLIREAYCDRIDELILNVDLVTAAIAKDDTAFKTANRAIYGEPNYDIFAAACAWIRSDLEDASGLSAEAAAARDAALELLPSDGGNPELLMPTGEVFAAVKLEHERPGGYLHQLFAGTIIPANQDISRTTGDTITSQVMGNVGSDFKLTESPSGLWAVLQSSGQVIAPKHYQMSPEAFKGIISHEIGSHLLESRNGQHAKLRLLEYGMDRYELGNEGRAYLREQIMFDNMPDYIHQGGWYPTKPTWQYRLSIHIVISLAAGLSGRKYDFAELYKLVTALFRYWGLSLGTINEESVMAGGWSMVTRALKGTSGSGGAYYKDIVYLEGNVRCWEVARSRPDLIFQGDKGKFDIANPKHVKILEALTIIP